MKLRGKRKELQGLVGALGVAAFVLGVLGGFYPVMTAIALAFAIWVVGATLVIVLTDPPG